jgi:hypothetical protein
VIVHKITQAVNAISFKSAAPRVPASCILAGRDVALDPKAKRRQVSLRAPSFAPTMKGARNADRSDSYRRSSNRHRGDR